MKVGIAAAVVLVFVFSPWLLAQGFYLWHLGGIPYRGKLLPVPRGWVVTPRSWEDTPEISFLLLPGRLIFSSARGGWGAMSFDRETIPHKSPEAAVQSLGKTLRMTAALGQSNPVSPGEMVVGPFPIKAAGGEAWCYTISTPRVRAAEVNCVLFGATWTADYFGPREHVQDFFRVIEGIREAMGQ